mmetsp:Transcript_25210/g.63900  ORF Transcript_25210/g.63900 Transcript_25210/m.63900 type:complete len:285 (-) Transcript_25210:5-859(-)
MVDPWDRYPSDTSGCGGVGWRLGKFAGPRWGQRSPESKDSPFLDGSPAGSKRVAEPDQEGRRGDGTSEAASFSRRPLPAWPMGRGAAEVAVEAVMSADIISRVTPAPCRSLPPPGGAYERRGRDKEELRGSRSSSLSVRRDSMTAMCIFSRAFVLGVGGSSSAFSFQSGYDAALPGALSAVGVHATELRPKRRRRSQAEMTVSICSLCTDKSRRVLSVCSRTRPRKSIAQSSGMRPLRTNDSRSSPMVVSLPSPRSVSRRILLFSSLTHTAKRPLISAMFPPPL